MTQPPPVLVGPDAIAELLGVHERTVRRWAGLGTIPAKRLPGGQWRFDPAEVTEWLASQP